MLPQISMTIKGLILLICATYSFTVLVKKEEAAWVMRAPILIFPLMFFIGMWGQSYWVAFAALTFALPVFAGDRAEAAALYTIITVSLPKLSVPIVIGNLYLVSVDRYFFCSLGLLFAFLMKPDRGGRLQNARFDIAILIVMILELAQARDPSVTAALRQSIPAFVTILLPYLVISRSLKRPEDVHRFLLAFGLAGFVMAAVATVEGRLHWLIYEQIQQRLHIRIGISAYSKMRAGMIRAPASFPESTSLGLFLVLAFLSLLAVRDSFASRTKWVGALLVILLGIASANSRGSVIALGIGLVAWDFYRRKYGNAVIKLAGAGAIYMFALVAAQFSRFFEAMVGKEGASGSTVDYRVRLLHRGMEEIRNHPWVGQNLKSALANLQDLRQGEGIIDLVNGYINYGLTLGYPGMAGLFLVFFSICIAMLLARRNLGVNEKLLQAAAVVFSVNMFSIAGSFFTGFGGSNSTDFYEMLALGGALWSMRGLAPVQDRADEQVGTPLSGLAGLIAADRNRAKVKAAEASA